MRSGVMCLSGHNHRAVVALARWAAATGVPLHLVGGGRSDPIALTDHARLVFVQRESPALDVRETCAWIAALRQLHGYERVVIAPSTEFFNRFLLHHRGEIEAAGGVVPLVDEALYVQLSDKQAFAGLCAERGIAVPAVFDRLPERVPFVAKPRRYLGAAGRQLKPCLVFTAEDRDAFLRTASIDDHFFQEVVEGESLYLLAHLARDGRATLSAQQNLMQQRGGGSIVLARAHDFHLEPDARPYLQLLREAGFHGLVMIEVRRCTRSGRAVMIEANPRMWGPQQFMLDRGVDPFAPLFADHGVEVPQAWRSAGPGRHYFWSGGLAPQHGACTFHDYSAERFVADYTEIAAADLFARADTCRLHRHELAHA